MSFKEKRKTGQLRPTLNFAINIRYDEWIVANNYSFETPSKTGRQTP